MTHCLFWLVSINDSHRQPHILLRLEVWADQHPFHNHSVSRMNGTQASGYTSTEGDDSFVAGRGQYLHGPHQSLVCSGVTREFWGLTLNHSLI